MIDEAHLTLQPIPPQHARKVWPLVEDFVARLDQRFPGWLRMDDPQGAAERGEAQMWLIWDGKAKSARGVVVTRILGKADKVLEMPIVAGQGMRHWLPLIEDIKHWARREGCTALVSTAARSGWLRVLKGRDWREKAVIMEMKL